MDVLISIIIPVKNGAKTLGRLLKGIDSQTLNERCEVIAIDSGSTDSSLTILESYACRVVAIGPASFNHGLTRNKALEFAKGKFILYTVQDAIPTDTEWLEKMVAVFNNEDVVAVCGGQMVPHDLDKNPVAWYRPQREGKVRMYHFNDFAEFDGLLPREKKMICGWDNVNAIYRRSVLEQIPFKNIEFGEDANWAYEAISAGLTIAYNDNAKIGHYHNETPEYSYNRSLTEAYMWFKLLGLKPTLKTANFKSILSIAKLLMKEKEISWSRKIKWFVYNLRINQHSLKAKRTFINMLKQGKEELDHSFERVVKEVPMAS